MEKPPEVTISLVCFSPRDTWYKSHDAGRFRCSTDFWRLATATVTAAAGVQWTHCHVQESGGGWLSSATLSRWKSPSADRRHAAAAEGRGVVGNNTLEVVGVKMIFGCRRCGIQSASRKYRMQPGARFYAKICRKILQKESETRRTRCLMWPCAADAEKKCSFFFETERVCCKILLRQVVIWVTAAFSVTRCQSGHSALATRRYFLPENNCRYLDIVSFFQSGPCKIRALLRADQQFCEMLRPAQRQQQL